MPKVSYKNNSVIISDIRAICSILREEVAQKFEMETGKSAIAGFVFLRFICPSIITPENFMNSGFLIYFFLNLVQISGDSRKFLTSIGKIVQNVANGLEFSKEKYMIPLNPMVSEYIPRMKDFLDNLAVNF